MIWSKGINEFVEAGKLLFKKYPNILLVGAEEKNNRFSPNKISKNLSLLPFIKWTNFRKDVPFTAISNIAVLPSYYKEGGYPGSYRANVYGIPVIAANTTDCRGPIVNNENGLLVEQKDFKIQ